MIPGFLRASARVPHLSRLALKWALLAAALAGLLLLAAALFKAPLADAFFQGNTAAFETAFARFFLLAVLGILALTAALFHRHVRYVLVRFFTREDHALNLAVLRIVVFALLLLGHGRDAAWYAALPEAFRDPPFGIGRLVDLGLEELLYFTPQQAEVAYAVFCVFCVTGLVGLFSRTSALIVVVLGVLPLAAPEFYGKVDHNSHHVFWFAALLSVSRCGDALALDAAIRAWRHPDEAARMRQPSRMYGLPLCFAWLLIGMLYFFPGFWKTWLGGYDWVAGDQLKLILHAKWFALFTTDGWTPPLRVDRWPVLYRLAGLATILFELFFVLLVFTRRTRVAAAAVGLGFHMGTNLLMRISFYPLVACYVIFFDWHRVLCRLGRRLFPEPLRVSCDEGSSLHRRAFAVLSAFDVLRRVKLVEASGPGGRTSPSPSAPEPGSVLAVAAGQRWYGAEAYRAAVWRVPLLWPFYPFLYVRPLLACARKRAHRVVEAPAPVRPRRRSLIPVTLVAAILFTGNAFCGIKKKTSAWPFACHPVFAGNPGLTSEAIMVDVEDDGGAAMNLRSLVAASTPMSYGRAKGLLDQALAPRDAAEQRARLVALWRMLAEENRALASAREIAFYRATFYHDPDLVWEARPPIRQELLYRFEPGGSPPASSLSGLLP